MAAPGICRSSVSGRCSLLLQALAAPLQVEYLYSLVYQALDFISNKK